MTLHTFGDSHALAGWEFINPADTIFEKISCNPLGPRTMALFAFNTFQVLDITTNREDPFPISRMVDFNVKENDAVVFCFGEIDCRAHLSYIGQWYYDEKLEPMELIDEVVPRYFESIKANVDKFNKLTTMVYNVVPPSRKDEFPQETLFPLTGTDESRKNVYKHMNMKIKEYCEKYNYTFFDVYDKYSDEEGFLNRDLSYGIHLKDPKYLIEFLKENEKIFH